MPEKNCKKIQTTVWKINPKHYFCNRFESEANEVKTSSKQPLKKTSKKSVTGFGNKKQSLTFASRFAREALKDEKRGEELRIKNL